MARNLPDVPSELFPEDYDEVRADWNDYYYGEGEYAPDEEEDEPVQSIEKAILVGGFDDLLTPMMRVIIMRRNRLIQAGKIKGKLVRFKGADQYNDAQDQVKVNGNAPKERGTSAQGSVSVPVSMVKSSTSDTPLSTIGRGLTALGAHEVNARKQGKSDVGGPRSMVEIDGQWFHKNDLVGETIEFDTRHKWNPSYLAGLTAQIIRADANYFQVEFLAEPPQGTRAHSLWEQQKGVNINNSNLVPFIK